jgi:hypothetical protein
MFELKKNPLFDPSAEALASLGVVPALFTQMVSEGV